MVLILDGWTRISQEKQTALLRTHWNINPLPISIFIKIINYINTITIILEETCLFMFLISKKELHLYTIIMKMHQASEIR